MESWCEELEQTCEQSEQDTQSRIGKPGLRYLTLEIKAAPNFSPRTTRTSPTKTIIA